MKLKVSKYKSLKTGDVHNFGKKVAAIEIDGYHYFFKPRNVYFEYQFLNTRSPFRKLVNESDIFRNYYSSLGNLEVNISTPTSGYSKQIVESTKEINSSDFTKFGHLLALSTIYGFIDLHSENVLLTNNGFQIIDLECLFFDCHSTIDSHLLYKRNNPQISFFNKIESSLNCQNSYSIIIEMINCFNQHINNADYIKNIVMNTIDFEQPIRILLRKTIDYNQQNNLMFFEEENDQLTRGDIPYFFSFVNDDNIYYWNTPDSYKKIKNIPSDLLTQANRSRICPSKLLSANRLKYIFQNSIVMTCDRLLSSLGVNSIIGNEMKIEKTSEQLLVQFKDNTFYGKY